ncbi:MAG: metallophosphoesterase, partial [Bacteroidota bacterium]
MRIIAFTDIHGSYARVQEILAKEKTVDAVILGGDLTTVGTPKEAVEAIRLIQSHGKPLFVVAGNMDLPELDETFDKLQISINAKGRTLNEAGFFGVSGSPFTPMHTPYEIPEEEIKKRAESGWLEVQSARWKIFVPHAPPRDTKVDRIHAGMHVGSTAVRAFIEKYQPDVCVCGHIHEARGTDIIGKTQIVNCGPAGKGYYAVIELGEKIKVENRG